MQAETPVLPHRRSRMRKRILLCLGLIGLTLLAARLYVGSAHAARLVSSSLSTSLGMDIQVGSFSPGLDSVAIGDVRLGYPESWVSAESIEADLSPMELLRGAMPRKLVVREGDVTLRFDAAGKLLTPMPEGKAGGDGTIPAIHLEKAKLTIRQEGKPDSVFNGVDADIRVEKGRAALTGTLADKAWGDWKLDASLDTTTFAATADLVAAKPVTVTHALLKTIPFVPLNVWQEIELAGETTATVQLAYERNKPFHYSVTVDPVRTTVYVPSIDLRATDAKGHAVIENAVVTLKDVHGQSADGSILVGGKLDFRDRPHDLHLAVEGKNLLVSHLPADWGLLSMVPVKGVGEGRLTGRADLHVAIGSDGATTGGSGKATLVIPKFIGGQDLTVEIKLAPRGRRFEFGPGKMDPTSFEPLAALLTVALQPPKEPTYIDLNFALRDVDLAELMQKLDVAVPFRIGGRITFKIAARIPTDQASDLKAYQFDGSAELPKLSVEDMVLENVTAKLRYRGGILKLTELHAKLPDPESPTTPGSFQGSAALGVVPAGDFSASLDLTRIPVRQVLGLVPDFSNGAQGHLAGHVEMSAPPGKLRDPAAWKGMAQLNSDKVVVVGLAAKAVRLDAKLAEGSLEVSKLSASIEDALLDLNGSLALAKDYPYKAHVDFSKVNLAALDRLAPGFQVPVKLRGVIGVAGDIDGQLRPATARGRGTGNAAGLAIDDFPIDKLAFAWSLDPEKLTVSDVDSALFGGKVKGTAAIPLRSSVPGTAQLELNDVDLAQLSRKLPGGVDLALDGKAKGTIQATLPAAEGGKRTATIVADVQAPKLRFRNIPAERLKAKADYRDGVLKYNLDAAALGGSIELEGRYPPLKPKEPASKEGDASGQLRMRGLQLSRLLKTLDPQNGLPALGGEFNLDLPYRVENGSPIGNGTFRLDRLRVGDQELSPRVQGAVRLSDSEIRMERIESPLGRGGIRGLVILNIVNAERSRAILGFRNVPTTLLKLFAPELAANLDASVDIELRTSLGRQIRGSGTLEATSGKYAGVRFGSVRVPVEWDWIPSQNRGSISFRDLGGDLGQGRITGKGAYEFFGYSGGKADGEIRFHNVNLPSLVATRASLESIGIGRVTGSFVFSGDSVRSFDDLKGTLTAKLGQTQLIDVPVLKELLPFLGPSGRVADRESDVRAKLSGGNWRLERLALVGQTLQLFAEGTIAKNGRLNLNVTANTGQLTINPALLRAAGIAIPAAVGPIPVALLLDISRYISNRTIHLDVTGTISNPTVRIKPFEILRDEVIRFFLSEANVPLP